MTMDGTGITGPGSVEAGSTGPVVIDAGESSSISVRNPRTGREVLMKPGDDGKVRFELDSTDLAGDVLLVVDPDNIGVSTTIEVTPASV